MIDPLELEGKLKDQIYILEESIVKIVEVLRIQRKLKETLEVQLITLVYPKRRNKK